MRSWKLSLLVVLGVAALVLAAILVHHDADAKGGGFSVEPDSGEAGTPLRLSATGWVPNTDVRIYAAYSTSLGDGFVGNLSYSGPIATVRSDTLGAWSAGLTAELAPTAQLADRPGFLFFRAESDGLPPYLENANVSYFVLTSHGGRPNGAGEIHVSITGPGSTALFGWRPAGQGVFTTPYSLVPMPFDTTIPQLEDGDWEVAAIGTDGVEPVGPGAYDIADTLLCLNPQCAADTPILTVHRAKRVTIRNGEIVSLDLPLARIDQEVSQPSSPSRGRTFGLVIGGGLAFLGLIAGGELVRRRLAVRE